MSKPNAERDKWMTAGEAAAYLGLDVRTVRNMGEPTRGPRGETLPPRIRTWRPTGPGGHRRLWRADVERIKREAGTENGPAEDHDSAEPGPAGPFALQHS